MWLIVPGGRWSGGCRRSGRKPYPNGAGAGLNVKEEFGKAGCGGGRDVQVVGKDDVSSSVCHCLLQVFRIVHCDSFG